jgi:hypothetical protein
LSSFCPGCGNSLSDGDTFCAACGRSVSATTAAPVDPAVAFGLPPATSGKAIFSLICGLLGLFPPAAVVAVIFGHLSLSEIRKSAGRLTGRGLATTGLVFGYGGVALGIVWLVLIGVSIPSAMRAQKAQSTRVNSLLRGSSAVSVVRAVNTAEIAYAQAHPASGYTCSLDELSETWGLKSELSSGKQNGYAFELNGCAAKSAGGPITKYRVIAYPLVVKTTGRPAYCSNESDAIRMSRRGSAEECLASGMELSDSDVNHPKTWPSTPSQ